MSNDSYETKAAKLRNKLGSWTSYFQIKARIDEGNLDQQKLESLSRLANEAYNTAQAGMDDFWKLVRDDETWNEREELAKVNGKN